MDRILVGGFVISGGYDADGECHWVKIYPASHSVDYRGFREGKGIWGVWDIRSQGSGGFHIWPLGSGDGEEAVTESAERELDAPGTLMVPLIARER